jgi:hypothetical protein
MREYMRRRRAGELTPAPDPISPAPGTLKLRIRNRGVKELTGLKEITNEIKRQLWDAHNAEIKARSCRLYAGQLLNELRKTGGTDSNWWGWCKSHLTPPRRWIEQAMLIAADVADEP